MTPSTCETSGKSPRESALWNRRRSQILLWHGVSVTKMCGSLRVYGDRLTTDEDRAWLRGKLGGQLSATGIESSTVWAPLRRSSTKFWRSFYPEVDRCWQYGCHEDHYGRLLGWLQHVWPAVSQAEGAKCKDLTIAGSPIERIPRTCAVLWYRETPLPLSKAFETRNGSDAFQSLFDFFCMRSWKRLADKKREKESGQESFCPDQQYECFGILSTKLLKGRKCTILLSCVVNPPKPPLSTMKSSVWLKTRVKVLLFTFEGRCWAKATNPPESFYFPKNLRASWLCACPARLPQVMARFCQAWSFRWPDGLSRQYLCNT